MSTHNPCFEQKQENITDYRLINVITRAMKDRDVLHRHVIVM